MQLSHLSSSLNKGSPFPYRFEKLFSTSALNFKSFVKARLCSAFQTYLTSKRRLRIQRGFRPMHDIVLILLNIIFFLNFNFSFSEESKPLQSFSIYVEFSSFLQLLTQTVDLIHDKVYGCGRIRRPRNTEECFCWHNMSSIIMIKLLSCIITHRMN